MPQYSSSGYSPVHLHPGKQPRKQRWYSRAFIFLLTVGLVAGIGYGSYWLISQQQKAAEETAAYEESHTKVTVNVTLNVPDYIQGSSSTIPIRVTGTDVDGNSIDQLEQMTLNNHGVTLLRGNYTFAPVGSPVTRGGQTYSIPTSATVAIDASGVSVNGSAAEGPTFDYTAIPAANVTDQQVTAIRTWMTDAGIQGTTVQDFIDAVTSARTEALQEAAKEQKKSVQKSTSTVQTSSYTFTLPETWWGKVTASQSTNAYGLTRTTVKVSDTDYELMYVEAVPDSASKDEGDKETHLVSSVEGEGGYRVEIWSTNWAYIAVQQSEKKTPDYETSELRQLVKLSTGSNMTYSEAIEEGDDVGTPDSDFLKEEVLPTVKATGD